MNFVTVGTVFRSFTFQLSFLRFLWFCSWRLALGDGLALLKVGLGDGVAKQVELEVSWGPPGGILGTSWGILGMLLGPLGSSWDALGVLVGRS